MLTFHGIRQSSFALGLVLTSEEEEKLLLVLCGNLGIFGESSMEALLEFTFLALLEVVSFHKFACEMIGTSLECIILVVWIFRGPCLCSIFDDVQFYN